MSLEISQTSKENTSGKVSILVKLQAEASASYLSRLFSYWRFLDYSISTVKIKWKKRNTQKELRYLLFCSSIDLFDVQDFKKKTKNKKQKKNKKNRRMVIWSENVFKGNFMLQSFHGQRDFDRENFLDGEHMTSSSTKTA